LAAWMRAFQSAFVLPVIPDFFDDRGQGRTVL
jgi:hypothetical protein